MLPETKVKGLVICPDGVDHATAKSTLGDYVLESDASLTFADDDYTRIQVNQSVIDGNGYLFLPAAGYRNGSSIGSVGSNGNFWSATSSSATNAYYVRFYSTGFYSACSIDRYYGFSVRLACSAGQE